MIDERLNELKKLSYNFYLSVLLAKDPLTFTLNDGEIEAQIEVSVSRQSHSELLVIIDTEYYKKHHGLLKSKQERSHSEYVLNRDDRWEDIKSK